MDQPAKPAYQRRWQFVIDKGIQNRIIWRFILTVIASIIFSNLISLGFLKIKEMFTPSSQDLIYLTNSMNENLAFTRALEILWLPLLISLVLGTVLVLVFGVFFSHRIAGPIFNLKRMMGQVEKGQLNILMKTRKKDEFKDVEEGFNRMVKSLHDRVAEIKKASEKVSGPGKKAIDKVLADLAVNE